MKRLRDEEAGTPLMRKAQLLIDAVDPVPQSRERMLRIRRGLDQPRRRFAAIRRLPALALATLVVLFGASAFAAVRIFVERFAPHVAPATQPAASGAGARRAHHAARTSPPAIEPAVSVPTTAVPATAAPNTAAPVTAVPVTAARSTPALPAGEQPASATVPSTHHTEPRVHAKPRPAVAAPSAVTNDSELVHRALKALRRDGDPALAARLLLENRTQNPNGPLSEEALSLQIEAASASHDPKAQQFAREYLARYPRGRYLSVARRALGEGTAP